MTIKKTKREIHIFSFFKKTFKDLKKNPQMTFNISPLPIKKTLISLRN